MPTYFDKTLNLSHFQEHRPPGHQATEYCADERVSQLRDQTVWPRGLNWRYPSGFDLLNIYVMLRSAESSKKAKRSRKSLAPPTMLVRAPHSDHHLHPCHHKQHQQFHNHLSFNWLVIGSIITSVLVFKYCTFAKILSWGLENVRTLYSWRIGKELGLGHFLPPAKNSATSKEQLILKHG